MREVVFSVQRVTDPMAEISAASGELSAGIEQLIKAISQIDQATQQNAGLVVKAAAVAESMRSQATSLAWVVTGFGRETTDARHPTALPR